MYKCSIYGAYTEVLIEDSWLTLAYTGVLRKEKKQLLLGVELRHIVLGHLLYVALSYSSQTKACLHFHYTVRDQRSGINHRLKIDARFFSNLKTSFSANV